MKKKVFLFAIALSLSVLSFAQEQVNNAKKMEAEAKNAVEAKQNDFLTNLQSREGLNKIKKNLVPKGSDQFWLEQGNVIKYEKNTIYLGKKYKYSKISSSDNFETVWKVIKDKKKEFTIDNFSNGTPVFSKATANTNKKGQTEGYSIVYSIRKCQTKLSYTSYEEDGKSSITKTACYNLTMTWYVEVEKKTNKIKESSAKLISIKATPNNDDELLKNMNRELNRLIKEWYENNIPNYFADKLNDDNIIKSQLSQNITSDYSVKELQKTVTITKNLPSVLIYVDPQKYMVADSVYVDNPTAIYTFNPQSFVITFSEDYKHGELSVEFNEGTLSSPQTLGIHERNMREAMRTANQTKNELVSVINDFTKNPGADNTKRFKSMFTEDGTVEISYFSQSGVKKKTRPSSKYVDKLRGVDMALEQISDPMVNIDAEPWSANIPFTQKTYYGKYCDLTNKRIFFVKDENGAFKIINIAVENDPVPCD